MGQQNKSLRVITLNYSGIYLSPFEFYAMDNWQQLEKIGIIFQDNLKHGYTEIKKMIDKVSQVRLERKEKIEVAFESVDQFTSDMEENIEENSEQKKEKEKKKKKKTNQYSRKNFIWMIQKLDKDYKNGRLSPLYIEIEQRNVEKKIDLHTYRYAGISKDNQTLMDQKTFNEEWMQKFNKTWPQAKIDQDELKLLNRFDFECYRAIVEYLFNLPENNHFFQNQNNVQNKNDLESENFLNFQEIINILKQKTQLPAVVYRLFMASYFCKIDQPSKMQATCNFLFKKWDLDVAFLQEVNQEFRQKLQNQNQNKYFLFGPKKHLANQCIILVKKTSRLVQSRDEQPRYIQNILSLQFYQQLNKYKEFFVEYWSNKKAFYQKEEDANKFFKNVELKGLFNWTEGFTLATLQNSDRIILGNFHLSSKEIKNKMQVQILGMLVYQLAVNGYKMILGGDFNSHIVIEGKDKTEGLFAFLIQYYKQKKPPRDFDKVTKQLFIYPKHPMIFTSKKKRTIMQAQVKKTNEMKESCIDQIISNYKIDLDSCYTGVLNGVGSGKNQNQGFLPTNEHPYDHFVVEAKIDVLDKSSNDNSKPQ